MFRHPILVWSVTAHAASPQIADGAGRSLRNHAQVLDFTFEYSYWHREEKILGIQPVCQL